MHHRCARGNVRNLSRGTIANPSGHDVSLGHKPTRPQMPLGLPAERSNGQRRPWTKRYRLAANHAQRMHSNKASQGQNGLGRCNVGLPFPAPPLNAALLPCALASALGHSAVHAMARQADGSWTNALHPALQVTPWALGLSPTIPRTMQGQLGNWPCRHMPCQPARPTLPMGSLGLPCPLPFRPPGEGGSQGSQGLNPCPNLKGHRRNPRAPRWRIGPAPCLREAA